MEENVPLFVEKEREKNGIPSSSGVIVFGVGMDEVVHRLLSCPGTYAIPNHLSFLKCQERISFVPLLKTNVPVLFFLVSVDVRTFSRTLVFSHA